MPAPSSPRVDRADAPGRVFLVGCPRSGTTLLQSMLFGHPDIISFPETFFFARVTPRRRLARGLGISARRAPTAYRSLRDVGLLADDASDQAPRWQRNCARDFTATLDATTLAAGKRLWIEKTPSHLHYAPQIQRHVPDARFLHIVRDGVGAIPSLYDVTNRFSDDWGGARSLDQCIERWREDVNLAASHAKDPRHAFVSYERLVDKPEAILRSLCDFLGLPTDPTTLRGMLDGRPERLGRVARDEPWKQGVGAAIANDDRAKIDRRLSPVQRDLVLAVAAGERPTLNRIPFLRG